MTDEPKPIKWCDDDGRSLYADMSSVTVTRDEISLLFGVSQMPAANNEEIRVRLKERIVLSPLVAKRFSIVLNNLLQNYESDFRMPKADHITGNVAAINENSALKLDHRESTKTDLLFHSLRGLNLKYGLERSFKISQGKMNDNRLLLGFSKDKIPADAHGKIRGICQQLDMPVSFSQILEQKLAGANYIHFGYEASGTSCIYKVYLEFYEKIKAEMQSNNNRPDQALLHLGFKWDASDNKIHALTRYTWHPWISVEDILMRIKQILDPEEHQAPLNIVSDIIKLAADSIPHYDFLYLDVTEEDNPRRSFDINMYRANIEMSRLKPFLEAIFHHYAIPEEKFLSLYDKVKTSKFGHISGGIDREGKDFLSLYYGVTVGSIEVKADARTRRISFGQSTKPGEIADEGHYLIEQVKGLDVKMGFERSFKFLPNMILPHRFLIGFKKGDIADHGDERILDICRKINMSADHTDMFRKNLAAATIVLFGYERHHRNSIYKAYLEFGGGFEAVYRADPDHPPPFIIHLGFKWDTSDPGNRTIARYTCFPGIDRDTIFKKIAKVLYDADNETSLEIAKGVVNMAADRIDPRTMLYFEATEEGNPRKSYDINLYLADVKMGTLEPWLYKMSRLCAIPDADFFHLYAGVKQHKLGHLTGGIDREGRNFFTVYFNET